MTDKPTLDAFTRAYLECALFTSDPEPSSGEWCESERWNIAAIQPTAVRQAVEDCRAFQADNVGDLDVAGDAEQNGHDFWLTRNYHGAGFWDRGYPGDLGRRLTDAAHAYGELNITGPDTTDQGNSTPDMMAAWDGVIYIE